MLSIKTILTSATKDSNSIPPSPRMPKIHNIHIRWGFSVLLVVYTYIYCTECKVYYTCMATVVAGCKQGEEG